MIKIDSNEGYQEKRQVNLEAEARYKLVARDCSKCDWPRISAGTRLDSD